jgi:integrase
MARRKRSVHGGGTVFQRKDGRWEAKFKVEETGKYKSVYGKTQKEATAKLEEAKLQQRQGTLATGPQQTVKQFLEYWLENVQKPAIRLGTYINNQVIVHKHLIPGLGHHKLHKLTAQQVQAFYAKKLQEGAAAGYVRRFQGVLHKALNHAKRLKLVGSNVTDDVDLPQGEEYQAPVLSPEQAQLLLEKAKERGLEVLLALAVSTGMRRGEILGLRWSDIDLARGSLQVSRTLSYLPNLHFVEGKPKTKSSERNILLPPFLIDHLMTHRALQEERKKTGADWTDRDLVFPNEMGDFIVPKTLVKQFHLALKDAGLPPMRFHDLRHSAATILLSKGVPANVVQELLGHGNVAITLGVYGSVIPSMTQDAARRMDHLLSPKRSNLSHEWERYSHSTQKCLETLMRVYGEEAAQLALDAIKYL